jgi:hypothetical protein
MKHIATYRDWSRLNESGIQGINRSIDLFFKGLREWIEENVVALDISLRSGDGWTELTLIEEGYDDLWTGAEWEDVLIRTDLIFRFRINGDPDKGRLCELGLVDEFELVDGLECRTRSTIDTRNLSDLDVTVMDFKLPLDDVFPDGRFRDPDYSFIEGLLQRSYDRDSIARAQQRLDDEDTGEESSDK